MRKIELLNKLESVICRGCWSRGVREYALELVENCEEQEFYESPYTHKMLLNGAENWNEYSWGGCSLIYDTDIAERLCTPSELKVTRNGERKPNKRESWLDVQARALYQAELLIFDIVKEG